MGSLSGRLIFISAIESIVSARIFLIEGQAIAFPLPSQMSLASWAQVRTPHLPQSSPGRYKARLSAFSLIKVDLLNSHYPPPHFFSSIRRSLNTNTFSGQT